MAKTRTDELVFLPLGGVGEIGMNLALYGYGPPSNRQWIMVDCGVTFPGLDLPGVDLVLLAGPHMAALAEALPAELDVVIRPTSDELKPVLMQALKAGDAVMVKSSKGIGFAKLVEALLKKFPAEAETTRQT